MRRKLRDCGLSLTMFGFFLVFLAGQSLTGWNVYNERQMEFVQPRVGYAQYLGSGHFMEGLFENWESEFLQMAAYVILTVFLFQRGSAESKDPDEPESVDEDPELHRNDPDVPSPVRRGGLALKLYNNSLSLAFGGLFALSFWGHAVGSVREFNLEQTAHGQPPVSLSEHMASARFWYESFQNWQSEFLAVAAIVVLSIWLRQKGSPESKKVFSPHWETGK